MPHGGVLSLPAPLVCMHSTLGLQPAPFMEAKGEAVQCHLEVRSACLLSYLHTQHLDSCDLLCKASVLVQH